MGRGYDAMKLIFAVLYVSLNDGLTCCYKTAVFLHFTFAVFRLQSIDERLPLPHLENKRTPYENSTSGFE